MFRIFSTRCYQFLSGNYNILLFCLVFLFIFRPYDRSSIYLGVWKFLLTGTILSAIFNCKHSPKVKLFEVALAIPTVLFCWWDLWKDQPWLLMSTTILSIAFTFVCTASIIYDVLIKSKVTFETLKGVICAYFLVAIGFAYLFWVIEYCVPDTFSIRNQYLSVFNYVDYMSEMFYFSFVTLLTIGFGDIVATKDVGQTAVVMEGIIGQFYVAILVARLVSIYSLSSQMSLLNPLKDKE